MENIRGNSIILNGKHAAVSDYQSGAAAVVYYEVIRVIKGKYLFLTEHLERLQTSCSKSSSPCPDLKMLTDNLQLLLKVSQIDEGNVKLVVYEKQNDIVTACFFVPHFYPEKSDYRTGVVTRTYTFERPDPNIKKWNEPFRERVNHFIREQNIYEAILVSEDGTLTEGSRSNLFFIDPDNRIITSSENIILPGITRKHVLEICHELDLEVEERLLDISAARDMQACFLTGTSPKVLPVCCLDQYTFDPIHPVLKQIMAAYNKRLEKYLVQV